MLLALISVVAALAAASTSAAGTAATQTLSIVGPWTGGDEQAFQAVLDAFEATSPGTDIRYTASSAPLATALAGTPKPDLVVLRLPDDLAQMRQLARTSTLRPVDFVAATVRDTQSFSLKQIGSVDGKLVALPFKATNDSAFWFDTKAFQSLGVMGSAPTWRQLRTITAQIAATGQKPFALSGQGTSTLPTLFQSVIMMQQGVQGYDRLLAGTLRWDSRAVQDALRTMQDAFARPGIVSGGVDVALEEPYTKAVQRVFGSPQRAAMVPGGSSVVPILQSAEAVRPVTGFDVIPFPSLNGQGGGRVVGRVEGFGMLRDTPAARSLVTFLAGPGAATTWAARGVGYLSPNRAVPTAAYPLPAMQKLASSLATSPVFRLPLEGMLTDAGRTALNGALTEAMRHPGRVAEITARLQRSMEKAPPVS